MSPTTEELIFSSICLDISFLIEHIKDIAEKNEIHPQSVGWYKIHITYPLCSCFDIYQFQHLNSRRKSYTRNMFSNIILH